MTQAPLFPHDEWQDIVDLVRAYARRKYGWDPRGITIHSPYREVEHYEPFSIVVPLRPRVPADSALGPRPSWDSGPLPQHLSDYRAVYWPGLGTFVLSELQGKIVQLLWAAMESGEWEVGQDRLLRQAGSDSIRLAHVFKGPSGGRAWGVLVIPGRVPGSYRLPPVEG